MFSLEKKLKKWQKHVLDAKPSLCCLHLMLVLAVFLLKCFYASTSFFPELLLKSIHSAQTNQHLQNSICATFTGKFTTLGIQLQSSNFPCLLWIKASRAGLRRQQAAQEAACTVSRRLTCTPLLPCTGNTAFLSKETFCLPELQCQLFSLHQHWEATRKRTEMNPIKVLCSGCC